MDRMEATDHAEPTPRWRSLLDRARLANRSGADEFGEVPPDDSRRSADAPQDHAHRSGPGDNGRAAGPAGRPAAEGRGRGRDRVIDPSRAAHQDGTDGQPWATPGPRQPGADNGGYGPAVGGGGLFEPVSSSGEREAAGHGGYREPAGGRGLFEPVSGGGYREPVSGGGYREPVSGGGLFEPVSGGGRRDPVSGGGLFEPVSGGGYREPVSGGGYSEPVSGGGGQSPIGRASGPDRNARPHDPATNGTNPAPRQPARGSARGPVAGRATPPAAASVSAPAAAAAPATYTGTGYIPAPATQPTTYGSSPTRAVAASRIGIPPQSGRGRGRMSGRVEWQAPPTNAGVDEIVAALRRDLGGSKVIAFANPKGGVHKTTATVLAAATIGGIRGRGVLAWDDNELRGTLGLRAGSARHARTIRHLVNDLDDIVSYHGDELLDRLDNYLRHASDGSYDVLAGEENPRFGRQLDPYTVRRVLELLRRTHEVICVDTGNNVESSNWQTILQMADQLVITTVPREDAAFTADWMLDLLYDTGLGDLAANAVTLLSCPTPNPSTLLQDLATHFATRTRAVAVVPYDPMLETGSSIEHTELAPATRRAWVQAAGVMIEPFVR